MLSTTLCSIPLTSCLSNASGCHSSTYKQLNELDQINAMIVSKSATINPQQGNQQPRLYLNEQICINSMGLPNKGIDYYTQYTSNHLYILSVYAYHPDELYQLFNNNNKVIEVNLSCPNVNNMVDYEVYLQKIHQIKKDIVDKIVGIKLPPFFNKQSIIDMSQLLLKYNIDFITCSNTIPNCLVIKNDKPVLYNNFGGMSFKHLSLSNVYQFYTILKDKVDIIGCGGVKTGQDVYDYILAGATCVQIGSQLLREGLNCFLRIENELKDIIRNKHYNHINDFKGQLQLQAKL